MSSTFAGDYIICHSERSRGIWPTIVKVLAVRDQISPPRDASHHSGRNDKNATSAFPTNNRRASYENSKTEYRLQENLGTPVRESPHFSCFTIVPGRGKMLDDDMALRRRKTRTLERESR